MNNSNSLKATPDQQKEVKRLKSLLTREINQCNEIIPDIKECLNQSGYYLGDPAQPVLWRVTTLRDTAKIYRNRIEVDQSEGLLSKIKKFLVID